MELVAFCALLSMLATYLATGKRMVLWLLLTSAFGCAVSFNHIVLRLFFLVFALVSLLTARRRKSEVALDTIFKKHPILTVFALAGAGGLMTFRVPSLPDYFGLVSRPFAELIRSNPFGKLEEMIAASSYPELSAVFRLSAEDDVVAVIDSALLSVMNAKFRHTLLVALASLAVLLFLLLVVPIIFSFYRVLVAL